MSFNRISDLEAQPTTVRRSEDAEYSDDPEYQRFTTRISEKLFSLTSNINQLSKQVALLNTKRETERVRERVQDLVEETSTGFKDIGEGLKKIATWPDLGPAQRYTQNKLNQEFRASLATFQVLQREAINNKQRATKAALEDQQTGQQTGSTAGQEQVQLQEQARLASQAEVDFQENLIVEREAEIRQIEQSVGELNELFRDVATMVQEQGQQLDTIGEHVNVTLEATRGADSELRKADRYQRSARGKACILLLILAIVLVVVVLAVVL